MKNFGPNEMKEIEDFKNLLYSINQTFDGDMDSQQEIEQMLETVDLVQKDYSIITKFVNNSNNEDPFYSNAGDSGFDLRAFINESITLKPLERKLIPTGLKFQLPPNTELQVRPRSGMALKHGISVLNTPGTVDEGYRGDVGIIAINLSNESYTIQPGERIAQGVIMNVIGQSLSKLEKTDKLNETDRGSGGFGSTGNQ